ncbi:hypothetical protein [Pseudomonas sp. HS6]|uniref:hypothetical protein n=1 Tax=Pseudomonas sp. HS6 TaxID=2850559 RepID=UPI002018D0D2|nr:hypothetical protein [Pseudomonas sp. HS6]UQS16663.1 hypothetical protein JJN09_07355 [Pseudomonas sp. HS6]
MDAKDCEALNISEKTMKPLDGHSGTDDVFVGKFDPPIPTVEEAFTADRFTYKAMNADTLGLFGKNSDPDYLVQVGFNIPKATADGRHSIVATGRGVSMSVLAGGQILHATGGEITFERDNEQKTVSATFKGKVLFTYDNQVTEHFIVGKLFLNATDPL